MSEEITNSEIGSYVKGPVLIVDDDEAFRRELEEKLREFGLEAIPLDSGSHCIKYVQNQRWNWSPSLVLTDIVMDGMGGYQLMRLIQQQYPNKDIPIIVISRLTAVLDIAEAETAGAAAYIKKPLKIEALREALLRIFHPSQKRPRGMVLIEPEG